MKDLLANCRNTCWFVAAVIAAIVALFTLGFTERGLIAALVLGALSLFFLGNIAVWLFCDGSKASASTTMGEVSAPAAAPVAASAVAGDPAPVASADTVADLSTDISADAGEGSVVETPVDAVSPASDSAESSDENSAVAAADAAEDVVETIPETAVDATESEVEAEGAASEPDMDLDFDKDGVVEGTDEGSKPVTLDAPREGGADDLKQIKGVGPKLEQVCFDLGFYHFDQIAAWTSDEIAWVDANLKGFKGRVSRDAWVDQAKILAAGGETEFSKRVEGGSVY